MAGIGTAGPTLRIGASVPDLDSLELLVAVAQTGSLNQAAARFGLTQPAVSTRLRRLERRIGVPLLERATTGTRLTAAGELTVGWAQELLAAAIDLSRALASLSTGPARAVRVAASQTIAESLLPTWLVALDEASSGTPVHLEVANSAQVAEAVRAGQCDLGFVEGPRPPVGLATRVVGHDHLLAVASPRHRWVGRTRPVSAHELATATLLVREHGSGTREWVERTLRALGADGARRLELSSLAAVRTGLAAGSALALLSGLAVRDDLAAGRLSLVAVEGLPVRRALRAVWRRGQDLDHQAGQLLASALRTGPRLLRDI
ncbi:MAG: LysR family transcriptional regulator [Actinomycetes bacterium]